MNQQANTLPFLKLFDPFAILEPEKVAVGTNPVTKSENFGSLLSVKKDVDVVDVFENVFITPQQVSRNNTDFDKEFAEFLDKYEEGKVGKLIDIPETTEKSENFLDEGIKVLVPKLHLLDDVEEDLIDELIFNKSIESNRLKEMSVKDSVDNNVSQINFPPVKCEKSNNSASEIISTNSKIEIKTPIKDNLKTHISDIETPIVRMNEPIRVIQTLKVNKEQIKTATNSFKPAPEFSYQVFIETVSKDPKVFQKRRIVKPEKDIMQYTKGADLSEKRIVLPQIMDRLAKRKIENDTKKNLPKKLILDTAKTVTENVCVSPEEMSPRDIRLNKTEEYFNQQQIGNFNIDFRSDSPNNSPSTSKDISEKSKKDLPFIDKNLLPNFSTKDLEREILLAMISRKISGTSKGESSNAKNDNLSPEVLMEDCNRQRLVEFEKRRLFENFVRKGKM